jgi:hypothetical protein
VDFFLQKQTSIYLFTTFVFTLSTFSFLHMPITAHQLHPTTCHSPLSLHIHPLLHPHFPQKALSGNLLISNGTKLPSQSNILVDFPAATPQESIHKIIENPVTWNSSSMQNWIERIYYGTATLFMAQKLYVRLELLFLSFSQALFAPACRK